MMPPKLLTLARQMTHPHPPPVPPLATGAVHLWQLDSAQLDPILVEQQALALISPDEQARAARIKQGRQGYLASRLLLRLVLAAYTGQAPASLAFARQPQGKPFLPNSNIEFSLSHSGELLLLAVSHQLRLGVDIELGLRQRPLLAIAEHYFAAPEIAWLRQLPGDEQRVSFYRLWCLKEAFFKALGSGIATGLDNICFDLSQTGIQAQCRLPLDLAQWQFYQATLGAGQFALAVESPGPVQLHWLDARAQFFT